MGSKVRQETEELLLRRKFGFGKVVIFGCLEMKLKNHEKNHRKSIELLAEKNSE